MASTITALTTGIGGLAQSGDASGDLSLLSDTTTIVALTAAGNVGIGKSSPGCILDILASGSAESCLTGTVDVVSKYASALGMYSINNPSAGTPQKDLFLIGANGTYSDAGVLTDNTLFLYDAVTSATRMLIDASGNVSMPAYGTGVAKFSSAGVISSGTVTESLGGTNQTTYTTGDILYASAANTLSKLPAGTVNHVLTSGGAGVAPSWVAGGSGTVTTVGFTGGIVSVATATTTPALTVAGTSGGIPYFSSASTWATSAALAANSLVQGGGAGVAPSTITTGANVITALGVAVGSAGAFTTFNGALGTPSSGTVTNLTGTASININGTVGATTPSAGTFTALSATSNAVGSVGAKAGGLAAVTAVTGSLTLATGGVTIASQVMASGSVWRVKAYGTYVAISSANVRNLTMGIFWGSSALTAVTSGAVLASTVQTKPWKVEIVINGTSATAAWCTGHLSSQVTSATIPQDNVATAASVGSLTTTSTVDFRVGQTGTATGDTINVHSVVIERIK
jgi:hypothetical protein